ncbi:hypothetical protein FDI09_gp19 [Mycobacterium phage Twister]|uniref:Uncharacterized protein n=4 Tax=Fromanvirus TaxID=186764 RepID=H9NCM4_9CAUD|nr:hypothetical protein FDI09_gp19 [Mycobacterium phage Twister]YP_009638905.1 hypothetical protein FGG47_gp18 [Mycobacterium phage Rebeuca]QBP32023.1 hypothetical protein SEA_KRISTOFF_74 [Mycobacterium phage Kristoff]QGJ94749.1 hypothetical protein SEA_WALTERMCMICKEY_75 [Mycobacterium phage WalterMcMickey]AFF28345.1 hypothetical protein TWISTER_76 [Mycobacterium phage Twister]AFQ97382.1 hypothetical protein REBEUCA_77 [Mycobacterium phage Rebeuca]
MARYNNRRRRPSGSRWMNLHFAGTCKVCGQEVKAGSRAYWDAANRTITCTSLDCADADGLVTFRAPTGPWEGPPEKRIRELAPTRIGTACLPRVHTIRLNSGAVLSVNARGRCEDAPCCGCCT